MAHRLKGQEERARLVAEYKLSGTEYVLARGKSFRRAEGWRFPVRKKTDPDVSVDDQPMVVTVLVLFDEIGEM